MKMKMSSKKQLKKKITVTNVSWKEFDVLVSRVDKIEIELKSYVKSVLESLVRIETSTTRMHTRLDRMIAKLDVMNERLDFRNPEYCKTEGIRYELDSLLNRCESGFADIDT